MSDDGQLPDHKLSDTAGVAYEYSRRYAYYIDLLRNEEPVFVTVNSSGPTFTVFASPEPVGEDEIDL